MILSNLPLLMAGAFLLFTLAAGIYFGKKTTSLKEYAVGHKNFATATLVATVLATIIGGGGLIRNVQQVHNQGLYWILFSIIGNVDIWMVSALADRMGPFMNHLSMAESIGRIYGKMPRAITAIACIMAAIATLAIQINVISLAINMCTGMDNPKIITIIATLILIFYSTFGGIRAVTYTDALQFITFLAIIPVLAWLMFQKTGKSMGETLTFLQTQEKFQFSSVVRWDTSLISIIALILSALMSAIEPPTIQRIYMASSPIQAKRVFLYTSVLRFVIIIFIVLVGIAVFVDAPDLATEEVWKHIIGNMHPFLKGLICISLLALTMSTADSSLNSCSVLISHDIVESMRGKKTTISNGLRLARVTSLIVGLSAMIVTFYYKDILELLKLSFDFSVPIITAPFVLAVLGFRGTSTTALIGMVTGAVTITAWNKWVEPKTDIDGSFFCMLANGIAMMVAHYSRPQPEGTGWMKEDDEAKQKRQAQERKKKRMQEEEKLRSKLEKLKPSHKSLLLMSFYIGITTLFSLTIIGKDHFTIWYVLRLITALIFFCYGMHQNKGGTHYISGKYWVIGLLFALSMDIFFHWLHSTNLIFTLFLAFVHLAFTAYMLPAHISIPAMVLNVSMLAYAIFQLEIEGILQISVKNIPLVLVFGVVVLLIIFYAKNQNNLLNKKIFYLEHQQKAQEEQKLKEIAYGLDITQKRDKDVIAENGTILENVVNNVTQAISFLHNSTPLYKEDFQSIINKFTDWALFLKRHSKSKDHLLLAPKKITLSNLISKVEVKVENELGIMPRIFMEKEEPLSMICDVDKIVDVLVTAVLRIVSKDNVEKDMVRLDIHSATLIFHQCEKVHEKHAVLRPFAAITIVISNYNTPRENITPYHSCYDDKMFVENNLNRHRNVDPEPMDITTSNMLGIIQSHYGYLELPKPDKDGILIALPLNVNDIREEMIERLPLDLLSATKSEITPKEKVDSLKVLIDFHEYACSVSHADPAIITEILLLLRRCYGFKRHMCGELFYVRAAGIATLVSKWVGISPKPVYAALLYDLVRYTHLSLSYIRANYNLGIFEFVKNILAIDKRKDLEESMLYIDNRFKDAVNDDQRVVLYVKLAERLYDLEHAAGYSNKSEILSMARETFAIDILLAQKYLSMEPEIAKALGDVAHNVIFHITKEGKE
ncbi:sodium:solute symporter family transporter [Cardinium endosymbiont of Culicoides punctatus]|uniref:sodium:solute symporter family transporter n=1 Tax=Cardinium endosymbiont of Culicoides punctatus TaxID=2304601 RepID=UPI001058C69F|nr:HD domain-containing protein [Cardinium endosymbiont of Culicoides punctatus]TDG94184.1 High-affinity proline transporter PutP [Cardinium endosymbiont of Culicoides punctatus]